MSEPLRRKKFPDAVVTGYVWDDVEGTLVPVWGPRALPQNKREEARMGKSAANPGKPVAPKPDKVITNWKMPNKIFRVKAHIPQPDGRLIVIYGNGFDHCMKLLASEVKPGAVLPYSIEVDYSGTSAKLWYQKTPKWENWEDTCCRDLADAWAYQKASIP